MNYVRRLGEVQQRSSPRPTGPCRRVAFNQSGIWKHRARTSADSSQHELDIISGRDSLMS
jgi:hypothetical protein